LSPIPNCPYELFPHVHIVPSAFSAAECVSPTSIFGTVVFSSGTTCTNITATL